MREITIDRVIQSFKSYELLGHLPKSMRLEMGGSQASHVLRGVV